MVSSSAACSACIEAFSSVLNTPWIWKAWRVVRRRLPLPKRRASADSASHCDGRANAAGQARARHEAVRGLELLQAPFLAQVAVVLQVGAVELDQRRVGVGQAAGERIEQAVFQRAAQAAARGLDAFDRGQRRAHQYTSRR